MPLQFTQAGMLLGGPHAGSGTHWQWPDNWAGMIWQKAIAQCLLQHMVLVDIMEQTGSDVLTHEGDN